MNRQTRTFHKITAALVGMPIAILAVLMLSVTLRVPRGLVADGITGSDLRGAIAGLSMDDRAGLLQRENQRLRAEPLDSSALVNLWILKNLAGDEAGSKKFALEAANRSMRNPLVQLVAIKAYVENRDLTQAFLHLDGLLTANPDMSQHVFPSVLQLLGTDDAVTALSKILKRNATWRNPFFIWLIRNDPSGQITFKVFSEIRREGGVIADGELRAYLAFLLRQKDFEKAYFVWLDSLNERGLLKVAGIFDGRFELQPRNLIFDWNIDQIANGNISIMQRPDAPGDRILHIEFYNNNKPFGHVYQYLRLPAGKHRLAGEWSATRFTSLAGLRWKLTCADRSEAIGESIAFNRAAPWTAFQVEFEVPASGCKTQFLRLQTASNTAPDVKLDGDISFGKLNIETANENQVEN